MTNTKIKEYILRVIFCITFSLTVTFLAFKIEKSIKIAWEKKWHQAQST